MLGLQEEIKNPDFWARLDMELSSLNMDAVVIDPNSLVLLQPSQPGTTTKANVSDENFSVIIGAAVAVGVVLFSAISYTLYYVSNNVRTIQSKSSPEQSGQTNSVIKYTSIATH